MIHTFPLICILTVLMVSKAQGQTTTAHTQDPGAKGADVVDAVVGTLRDSCLYSDDDDFLRRMAFVESHDGTDYMTYRQGYDGGIWQLDKAQFERTQTESARLTQEYTLLLSKLSIDWHRVSWSDLLKPLYSGIAAALLLKLEGAPVFVPKDLAGQANFWLQHVRHGRNGQDFVDKANAYGQNCARSNKVDVLFMADTSTRPPLPD